MRGTWGPFQECELLPYLAVNRLFFRLGEIFFLKKKEKEKERKGKTEGHLVGSMYVTYY